MFPISQKCPYSYSTYSSRFSRTLTDIGLSSLDNRFGHKNSDWLQKQYLQRETVKQLFSFYKNLEKDQTGEFRHNGFLISFNGIFPKKLEFPNMV